MNRIKKYPNISFYFINFFLTGILFALSVMLQSYVSFSFFLLAPAMAAYTMAVLTGRGVRAFSKEIFLQKVRIRWLLVSILLPVIVCWSTDIIVRLLHDQQLVYRSSVMPVTFLLLVQVVVGAFTEEIGWRGFMLPRMIKRYGHLRASIILGLVWGLWHMGDYGEGLGFVFFVLTTIGMSIIMTWLFEKGNGSIFTAGLFHTFYNLTAVYVGSFPEMGRVTLIYRVVAAAACLIPALILVAASPIFKRRVA